MPHQMNPRTKRSWRVAGIALAGVLMMSGCASGEAPEPAATADVSQEAAEGGELRMLMYVPTRSFDPADDNEADALALLDWALRNGGRRRTAPSSWITPPAWSTGGGANTASRRICSSTSPHVGR